MKLKLQVVLLPVAMAEVPTLQLKTFRKFLHIAPSGASLAQVCKDLVERYYRLYPNADTLHIEGVQDNDGCDLDPEFLAGDVFASGDILRVLVENAIPSYSRDNSMETSLILIRKLTSPETSFQRYQKTVWSRRLPSNLSSASGTPRFQNRGGSVFSEDEEEDTFAEGFSGRSGLLKLGINGRKTLISESTPKRGKSKGNSFGENSEKAAESSENAFADPTSVASDTTNVTSLKLLLQKSADKFESLEKRNLGTSSGESALPAQSSEAANHPLKEPKQSGSVVGVNPGVSAAKELTHTPYNAPTGVSTQSNETGKKHHESLQKERLASASKALENPNSQTSQEGFLPGKANSAAVPSINASRPPTDPTSGSFYATSSPGQKVVPTQVQLSKSPVHNEAKGQTDAQGRNEPAQGTDRPPVASLIKSAAKGLARPTSTPTKSAGLAIPASVRTPAALASLSGTPRVFATEGSPLKSLGSVSGGLEKRLGRASDDARSPKRGELPKRGVLKPIEKPIRVGKYALDSKSSPKQRKTVIDDDVIFTSDAEAQQSTTQNEGLDTATQSNPAKPAGNGAISQSRTFAKDALRETPTKAASGLFATEPALIPVIPPTQPLVNTKSVGSAHKKPVLLQPIIKPLETPSQGERFATPSKLDISGKPTPLGSPATPSKAQRVAEKPGKLGEAVEVVESAAQAKPRLLDVKQSHTSLSQGVSAEQQRVQGKSQANRKGSIQSERSEMTPNRLGSIAVAPGDRPRRVELKTQPSKEPTANLKKPEKNLRKEEIISLIKNGMRVPAKLSRSLEISAPDRRRFIEEEEAQKRRILRRRESIGRTRSERVSKEDRMSDTEDKPREESLPPPFNQFTNVSSLSSVYAKMKKLDSKVESAQTVKDEPVSDGEPPTKKAKTFEVQLNLLPGERPNDPVVKPRKVTLIKLKPIEKAKLSEDSVATQRGEPREASGETGAGGEESDSAIRTVARALKETESLNLPVNKQVQKAQNLNKAKANGRAQRSEELSGSSPSELVNEAKLSGSQKVTLEESEASKAKQKTETSQVQKRMSRSQTRKIAEQKAMPLSQRTRLATRRSTPPVIVSSLELELELELELVLLEDDHKEAKKAQKAASQLQSLDLESLDLDLGLDLESLGLESLGSLDSDSLQSKSPEVAKESMPPPSPQKRPKASSPDAPKTPPSLAGDGKDSKSRTNESALKTQNVIGSPISPQRAQQPVEPPRSKIVEATKPSGKSLNVAKATNVSQPLSPPTKQAAQKAVGSSTAKQLPGKIQDHLPITPQGSQVLEQSSVKPQHLQNALATPKLLQSAKTQEKPAPASLGATKSRKETKLNEILKSGSSILPSSLQSKPSAAIVTSSLSLESLDSSRSLSLESLALELESLDLDLDSPAETTKPFNSLATQAKNESQESSQSFDSAKSQESLRPPSSKSLQSSKPEKPKLSSLESATRLATFQKARVHKPEKSPSFLDSLDSVSLESDALDSLNSNSLVVAKKTFTEAKSLAKGPQSSVEDGDEKTQRKRQMTKQTASRVSDSKTNEKNSIKAPSNEKEETSLDSESDKLSAEDDSKSDEEPSEKSKSSRNERALSSDSDSSDSSSGSGSDSSSGSEGEMQIPKLQTPKASPKKAGLSVTSPVKGVSDSSDDSSDSSDSSDSESSSESESESERPRKKLKTNLLSLSARAASPNVTVSQKDDSDSSMEEDSDDESKKIPDIPPPKLSDPEPAPTKPEPPKRKSFLRRLTDLTQRAVADVKETTLGVTHMTQGQPEPAKSNKSDSEQSSDSSSSSSSSDSDSESESEDERFVSVKKLGRKKIKKDGFSSLMKDAQRLRH